MSMTTMVVLIVLIAMIGRVLAPRYRSRHQHDAAPVVDSAETMRLREDVRQLRERVQVLERVITDNHDSVDLGRQIEQLRDR